MDLDYTPEIESSSAVHPPELNVPASAPTPVETPASEPNGSVASDYVNRQKEYDELCKTVIIKKKNVLLTVFGVPYVLKWQQCTFLYFIFIFIGFMYSLDFGKYRLILCL